MIDPVTLATADGLDLCTPVELLRDTGVDPHEAQEAWADGKLVEVPVGRAWDVVRLERTAGWETVRHLRILRVPIGPILHTCEGVEVLVAAGSADDWDLPDSTVLPAGEVVGVPHPVVVAPATCNGKSWVIAPRDVVPFLTDAADLYGAYAAARVTLDSTHGRRR